MRWWRRLLHMILEIGKAVALMTSRWLRKKRGKNWKRQMRMIELRTRWAMENVFLFPSWDSLITTLNHVNDSAEEATELKEVGVCNKTENNMKSGKEGHLNLISFSNSCEMFENAMRNATGNLMGNLTGNVMGNIMGNVTGNLMGNLKGNVMGNVMGNAMGNLRTIPSQHV